MYTDASCVPATKVAAQVSEVEERRGARRALRSTDGGYLRSLEQVGVMHIVY